MTNNLVCWNCGASLDDVPRPISRHANCASCFEVLRCCRMCRHYEPDKRPYCDHERADPPAIKESANFCDFFKPANRYDAVGAEKAGNARGELDALFSDTEVSDSTGEVESDENPDDPLNKLKGLFDD